MFALTYHQHGGSGLGLSLTEILDLEWGRLRWLGERLAAEREREAKAIEQAARRGRR